MCDIKAKQKGLVLTSPLFIRILNCALNFTGSQAAGAGVDSLYLAVNNSFNCLDVWFPLPLGFQVGVAYVKTAALTFITDFTEIGHLFAPPLEGQKSLYSTFIF